MQNDRSRLAALPRFVAFLALIAGGAHLSGVPFVMLKVVVAVGLVFGYGVCTVMTVSALRIESGGVRKLLGLVGGVAVVYLTWAVRIPAFSGWETSFDADPVALWNAILERSGSMELSRSVGSGTTAAGPSWLLMSLYFLEAGAFLLTVWGLAALSSPDKPEAEADDDEARAELAEAA